MDWNRIMDTVEKYYLHVDEDALKVATAVAGSSRHEDKFPLFLVLIGPYSSGRTTILDWLEQLSWEGAPLLLPVDEWTPAGFQDKLDEIAHRTLSVTDFSLLVAREDEETKFAQLRIAYDGKLRRWAQSGADVDIGRGDGDKLYFHLLMGATPAWDQYQHLQVDLGPRILAYRLPHKSDNQKYEVMRKMGTVDYSLDIDKEIGRVIQEEYSKLNQNLFWNVAVPEKHRKFLADICLATELLRQGLVQRDVYGVGEVPTSEIVPGEPQRLYGQILKLSKVLAWLDGKSVVGGSNARLAAKCGFDTIPSLRYRLVNEIYKLPHEDDDWIGLEEDRGVLYLIKRKSDSTRQDLQEFASYLNLPSETLQYFLDELEKLRIVDRKEDSWGREEIIRRDIQSKGTDMFWVSYRLDNKVRRALELLEKEEFTPKYQPPPAAPSIDEWRPTGWDLESPEDLKQRLMAEDLERRFQEEQDELVKRAPKPDHPPEDFETTREDE